MRRGSTGVHYGNSVTLLDAANFVVEAWDAITASTLTNSFGKAEIISSWKVSEADDQEAVQEMTSLLQNCSISDQLDFSTIEEEVNQVINADNEDSEEMQKCLLEDIDEIIKLSEQGLTINNNEDESEIIEIGDTFILEEKVREIDIKSILQLADSFHESLHEFKQQQKICKEEINSCLDACDQVRSRGVLN